MKINKERVREILVSYLKMMKSLLLQPIVGDRGENLLNPLLRTQVRI